MRVDERLLADFDFAIEGFFDGALVLLEVADAVAVMILSFLGNELRDVSWLRIGKNAS